MAKKKQRKNRFIVWLTNRYELIVRNEADFAERRTLTFTYAQVLFSLFFLFALMMGSSLLLSKTLLSEWFNPEYKFNNLKYEIEELAQMTDSLEHELVIKDQFIMTIKKRFDPEYIETKRDKAKEQNTEENLPIVDKTIDVFEGDGSDVVKEKALNIAHQMLIFPVDTYNALQRDTTSAGKEALLFHLNIDQNIKSIKEGVVEICTWDKDVGNVMVLNHNDGLKTTYNGLGVLMKKTGDFVSAGDIIALSGKNYSGANSVVKFEMWHNDRPLNAENYFIIKK